MAVTLDVRELRVSVEGKMILKGVNLTVRQGEIHVIMGPNGSGKSTLANTLMGHPKYKIEGGDISLNGLSILALTPDSRAKKGLFLAFQYPTEIAGVSLATFLRAARRALDGSHGKRDGAGSGGVGNEMISALSFKKQLESKLAQVNLDPSFAGRYLNEGFSGGEKKRAEILQMTVLEPAIAIMDETDSGLDIDAVREVANVVKSMVGPKMGVLLITHYQRILQYIRPDYVHVMVGGRIVRSGDAGLAQTLEQKGYDWIEQEMEIKPTAP